MVFHWVVRDSPARSPDWQRHPFGYNIIAPLWSIFMKNWANFCMLFVKATVTATVLDYKIVNFKSLNRRKVTFSHYTSCLEQQT